MLPPNVADIARRRVAIELEERRKTVAVEVQHVYHEATKAGALRSGRTLVQVREILGGEYRARAGIVLGVWRRSLGSAGVLPTKEIRQDLLTEIEGALDVGSPDLPERYEHTMKVAYAGSENPQQVLLTMRSKALEWAASEIDFDITVAASSVEATRQGTTTFNIYGGQVGAIQTGPSATATVNQSDVPQILRALQELRRALVDAAALPDVERTQILEVVDQAVAEVQKPKPNALAVRSLLSGIATSVQTLGSAASAYALLKGALALLGVHLP